MRGRILGPGSWREADSVTLYLHEFSFGRFFWNLADVPSFDYARAMAGEGHVSVVIDRLGYDSSDHPPGTETCLGAQADIAAQIVRQLKSGEYDLPGNAARAFSKVILAGHSVGAAIAELAVHSFDDLDLTGLIIFGWADQGYSPRSVQQSLRQGQDCWAGGEPAEPGAPGGYAFFGRSSEDFKQNVFANTDPAVMEVATRLRNRDPCGDNATLARVAAVNIAGIGEIRIPVLMLFGESDAIFVPGAGMIQAMLFTSSPDVQLKMFPGAGHALVLERAAPSVRAEVLRWLGGRAEPSSRAPLAGSKDHDGMGATNVSSASNETNYYLEVAQPVEQEATTFVDDDRSPPRHVTNDDHEGLGSWPLLASVVVLSVGAILHRWRKRHLEPG